MAYDGGSATHVLFSLGMPIQGQAHSTAVCVARPTTYRQFRLDRIVGTRVAAAGAGDVRDGARWHRRASLLAPASPPVAQLGSSGAALHIPQIIRVKRARGMVHLSSGSCSPLLLPSASAASITSAGVWAGWSLPTSCLRQ